MVEDIELVVAVVVAVGAIAVPLIFGIFASMVEKQHFARLDAAEAELAHIALTDTRQMPPSASDARLVFGEVVIGCDAFKTFLFGFRGIVGGESRGLTALLTRARREALVRLRREAIAAGCNAICNIRLEPVDITGKAATNGNEKQGMSAACIMAYGTAYRM